MPPPTHLQLIGAYACLFPPEKYPFERFQSYRAIDFQRQSDISPPLRCIHHIMLLTHKLLDAGNDTDCLIQFIVDPCESSFRALHQYFQWDINHSQALKMVLCAQFQQRDWTHLQQGEDPISALSHAFMSIFEQWERLEWTDLGNQERLRAHELAQIFRSFFPCAKAMLSVWGDNTGFDATADRQSLKALNEFLAELLQSDF